MLTRKPRMVVTVARLERAVAKWTRSLNSYTGPRRVHGNSRPRAKPLQKIFLRRKGVHTRPNFDLPSLHLKAVINAKVATVPAPSPSFLDFASCSSTIKLP